MDYTVELAENTELLAFDGTIRKIESLAVARTHYQDRFFPFKNNMGSYIKYAKIN
jgi:hypothetical protein